MHSTHSHSHKSSQTHSHTHSPRFSQTHPHKLWNPGSCTIAENSSKQNKLTIGFSARSSEMLLLDPSLLSFVEQLLKCGRNGLVLPMSMIECVATKIEVFKTHENVKFLPTHETLPDCFCSQHETRNRLAFHRYSPEQMEARRRDDVSSPATGRFSRSLSETTKVGRVDRVEAAPSLSSSKSLPYVHPLGNELAVAERHRDRPE